MKKTRKRTTFKEDMGKFLLDFGKLVFAGIVFGSLMRSQIPQDTTAGYIVDNCRRRSYSLMYRRHYSWNKRDFFADANSLGDAQEIDEETGN